MEDYENSRSSPGLVSDCLRLLRLAGKQCALSNWIGIADAFLHSDKMTEALDHSLYGMTFVHLTAERGVGSLMLCLEASLAKHTAPLLQARTTPTIFGLKCEESWQMRLPGTYLRKTSAEKQLTLQQTTSKRWITKPDAFPLKRETWVVTTYGKDFGYLHTPTTKANYAATSMQKWPSCRNYVKVFGKVAPEYMEWMMATPTGWSDLRQLEMDKFHAWLLRHYSCLRTVYDTLKRQEDDGK